VVGKTKESGMKHNKVNQNSIGDKGQSSGINLENKKEEKLKEL